jgi:phage baseplate assembly protein W
MAKIFSSEDGNLSRSNRVVRERLYSDIDLSLEARIEPTYTDGDGDILVKTDAASVKQSIKNLLLTNRYEKPYRPQFGGDLGGLLFELMDGNTGDIMVSRIKSAIQRYEPRAKILDLKIVATPDYNSVSVVLEFRIVNSQVSDQLRIRLTDTPAAAAVVLPVTPAVEPDEILLTTEGERLVTLGGDLLRADELGVLPGSLLTVGDPDAFSLLTEDEFVLIGNQF